MRVLVVDDSATQRMMLASALREISSITEVETAASGEEALQKARRRSFDLVTLDLTMPGLDGFAVLRWLMANRPVPVLVVSDRRHDGSALEALELGAYDVIGKASPRAGGLAAWKRLLSDAIAEALQIDVRLLARRAEKELGDERRSPRTGQEPTGAPLGALVVASSTGGPGALRDVFLSVPPSAVFAAVAQHMPAPFTKTLAARLAAATGWDASEPRAGEAARPGSLWIAPGGRHLEFDRGAARVIARISSPCSGDAWCPSGDLLFQSAARLFGPRVVAVVLTGMGDDGAAGAAAVAKAGGTVICESGETAVVPGMPDAAARAVPGALRLPLPRIGDAVAAKLREKSSVL